ncbi:DUF5522 domain-containing protein [Polluticoccus soli]|uniref:DUF5522 domain-containing protein n=1 Tax=Polluticoccus soli TaxID=3034150 RepID=UPI0023E28408|nr:DUF5522 domain-containing protein [Flavipsychrobacter sp. JY13-12]
MNQLKEGIDYYILPDGRLVFTAKYLSDRGFCCGNGCMHCPYEYIRVREPLRTQLLLKRQRNEETGDQPG